MASRFLSRNLSVMDTENKGLSQFSSHENEGCNQ